MKFKQSVQNKYQQSVHSSFYHNEKAWIDLILSKTALICATLIIISAAYHLANDFQQLSEKNELEIISKDLTYSIDAVGRSTHGTLASSQEYSFKNYEMDNEIFSKMNVSVSGEYVSVSYQDKERMLSAAEPLMYKTLAFTPDELSNKMITQFSASGNVSDPIHYPHTYEDISNYLAIIGTKDKNLNTSTKVNIVKTLICCANNTEVKKLEYILVYQ
jgi:hypothetical protein